MSRRHTSILGASLALLIALTALLPVGAVAQGRKISDSDVEHLWQLLTYVDADGDEQDVPPGVGATMLLHYGNASGEAACSTYDSRYTRSQDTIFIDPPTIERFACDAASEAFDADFYRNLANAASLSVTDSILSLRNEVGRELMTFTRARIADDPTVARWKLARIGYEDGSVEPVIAGLDPWIEFLRGGSVVGSTGCGRFLGKYLLNDGTMSISDVAHRLDYCSDTARRQAEDIVAALDAVSDFQVLPAGMALKDESGTTRLALIPSIELAERIWTPTEILDAQGEVLYRSDRLNTSAVKFFGGKTEGRSICRPFQGKNLSAGLALSNYGIKFEGESCTGKKDLDKVENAFIDALRATASHALRGSELELRDVRGRTRVRLLPQADLVGPTWVLTKVNLTPKAAKVRKQTPKMDVPVTAAFDDIEVVDGDTGAARAGRQNGYVASYRVPAATRIDISPLTITGNACGGRKLAPGCKTETRFRALMQQADGYIVTEGELRLLQGTVPLLWFEPEVIQASEEG